MTDEAIFERIAQVMRQVEPPDRRAVVAFIVLDLRGAERPEVVQQAARVDEARA